MQGHVNLCSYATDEKHLYEIWDNDLRKCIKRRTVLELAALIWVLVCASGLIHPGIEWFIGVLVGLVYAAIRQFVDESNVNYLMHSGDWRNAAQLFRDS
jgi:hypothetical protein